MIHTIRLSYAEVAQELSDFLDVEADMNSTAEEGYWYTRGAIEFAQHLKAAMSTPELH